MPSVEIKPDIYWIGVNDRTTDLFEGLWPVSEEGVSYNTYLINDEKKVIIDLVKAFKGDDFFEHIDEIVPLSQIDYVILNHMEPDHTGVIRTLNRIAPDITIVGSAKMKGMLEAYYGITENVKVVEDGETLSIGKRTLQFFSTPFVHWPETIMTYEQSDQILFACDAFGSYGALPQIDLAGESKARCGTVSKVGEGCVRRCRSRRDDALRIHVRGNTESMMNTVAQGVSKVDIPLEIFDVARTHVSYILPSLWTKSGVAVGTPTYEGKFFSPMAQVLNMAVLKRIVNKKSAYFGSYGWSKGALKQVQTIVDEVNWEMVEPLEFHGGVTESKLKEGKLFGKRFAESLVKR